MFGSSVDDLLVPGKDFHVIVILVFILVFTFIVALTGTLVSTISRYVFVPCRPDSVAPSRVVRALRNFVGGLIFISVVGSSWIGDTMVLSGVLLGIVGWDLLQSFNDLISAAAIDWSAAAVALESVAVAVLTMISFGATLVGSAWSWAAWPGLAWYGVTETGVARVGVVVSW
jgi:hypothetical protein